MMIIGVFTGVDEMIFRVTKKNVKQPAIAILISNMTHTKATSITSNDSLFLDSFFIILLFNHQCHAQACTDTI